VLPPPPLPAPASLSLLVPFFAPPLLTSPFPPQADLHANIDYLAPNGAPDNDRKAKESSWLVSQAFIEGLRYYPSGKASLDSNDSEATYSGNTHSKRVHMVEHMETDLRARLEIAPRQDNWEWRDDQLPREWVPEKRPSMVRHMAKVRERLKR
jgi:hypothetical protein